MSNSEVVVNQPWYMPAPPGESGPVNVKFMTKEDVAFAAEMAVEGFRSKMECAVGKNNLEKTKELLIVDLLASPDWVYQRHLIAFYNGERAGVCALKFHGDKHPSNSDADYPPVGCCLILRLTCMQNMFDEKVPRNAVYVDHIAVDSKFRGKGIGKVLLDRADYEARKINAELIYLMVTQDNRARNLYTRHGYQIVDDINGGCMAECMVGVKKFYKMSKPLK